MTPSHRNPAHPAVVMPPPSSFNELIWKQFVGLDGLQKNLFSLLSSSLICFCSQRTEAKLLLQDSGLSPHLLLNMFPGQRPADTNKQSYIVCVCPLIPCQTLPVCILTQPTGAVSNWNPQLRRTHRQLQHCFNMHPVSPVRLRALVQPATMKLPPTQQSSDLNEELRRI